MYYVYFIRSIGTGKNNRMKIGYSRDPEKRLKQLQTGNCLELKIEAKICCKDEPTARHIEKLAHQIFKSEHKRGEWFRLSAHLLMKCWELAGLAENKKISL